MKLTVGRNTIAAFQTRGWIHWYSIPVASIFRARNGRCSTRCRPMQRGYLLFRSVALRTWVSPSIDELFNTGVGSTYQCDEYPYASTYEGGDGAWAACIPQAQNSNQGGTLSAFLSGRHDGFQVSHSYYLSLGFHAFLWCFSRRTYFTPLVTSSSKYPLIITIVCWLRDLMIQFYVVVAGATCDSVAKDALLKLNPECPMQVVLPYK
jgi:hypothetical protein